MDVKSLPLSVFNVEFLKLYRTGRHARKTLLKMEQVLREFAALPEVSNTADFTTANVASYVLSKGPDANGFTVNGMLDYLRAATNYAIEEGYLERGPNWKRVRPRRGKPTRNRPCSYEEVARLLDHLERRAVHWESMRLRALVALIVLTGARRDEALYARPEDVQLVEHVFAVVERERRLKTEASARGAPMPDSLVEILRGWLPHVEGFPWLFPGVRRKGPWTGGGPGGKAIDHLKRAAAEVGIRSITWHGLRHTYGTNALRHFGLPCWVVQRSMGHTDARTTERYLHLDDPQLLVAHVRAIAYTV